MSFKTWEKITIEIEDEGEYQFSGKKADAIAPVILSASRATDIPAFYADWFITRFRRGYLKWINPFNRSEQYISFSKTRVIVFWSKNPFNLLKYLPEIDQSGINYYFQFTLNDYEDQRLESNIPNLEKRIDIFHQLSDRLGNDRIIWRFDPLLLTDNLTIDDLINKIETIGQEIHNSTNRLIISFIDINDYPRVKRNLANNYTSNIREFTLKEKQIFESFF